MVIQVLWVVGRTMDNLESVVLSLDFCHAPVTPCDAMRSLEEARAVEVAHVEPWVFLE